MSATKICPQCNTEYPEDQRFCPRDGSALKLLSGAGDLVGSVIADRYHVTRKLGEGGMGQVYLAEHVRMGRRSAVKVMHPAMVNDADAITRFNREAANASRISHPNVAAIYDFGETPDGLIYLAMEFVEGEPLRDIIERDGPLAPRRVAGIVAQTAGALGAAHDIGIVHRDLKPDNIMIARDRDGSDCVKVVDFGIAKAANSEVQRVTRTGLIVGTPEYMSPEQLAGDPVDARSDVYSLALVAFAMLTGTLPFPSATAQAAMITRLTERPRTLAEARPERSWPAELQAVMDRGLARDAAARYQTAAELARELGRAVERMPDAMIAEAGTAILAAPSVPRTRVAPAPSVVGAAAAPAHDRHSRVPIVVGGATVAVGAIVAFALLARPRSEETARAGRDGAGAVAGAPDSSRSGSAQRALPNGSTGPATAGGGPAGFRAGKPSTPAAAAVEEVRRLSVDQYAAAISRADAVLPTLATGADSARVLYYQAFAYVQQDDMPGACRAARRIRGAGPPDVRSLIAQLKANCP